VKRNLVPTLLVLSLEFTCEVVHKTVVKVLTTKVRVTGCGLDLKDTLLNGQEGNIKGTTTQVENEDVALALRLLVKTVGNGSSSGLVDDAQDIEAGNETSVLGSLALRVVEVSRDGDDGVVDGAAKVRLSRLPHLGQDHGRDFLGREDLLLALELDLDHRLAALVGDLEGEVLHVGLDFGVGKLAADEALGVEDGVDGVHGDLVLGRVPDETLCVGEGDKGWRCAVTLVVCDNLDAVISEDTDTRVGRAQIDTNRGGHGDDVWR